MSNLTNSALKITDTRAALPEPTPSLWPPVLDDPAAVSQKLFRPESILKSCLGAATVSPALSEIKFVLVGFGPHCLRTHLSFFKKHQMSPAVIVELESGREAAQALIREMNWKTALITFNDDWKNEPWLPKQAATELDEQLLQQGLTHAVIASEPKGRLMYLRYFLERGLDILADKPLMAFTDMTDPRRVDLLKKSFTELVSGWSKRGGQLKLLCQRSEHLGYNKIRRLVSEVIDGFDIPITHLTINACDGNWVMPHDLDYENHPYKYGYGKLFHSGYHYVALLADLLRLNSRLSPGKRIIEAEMSGHFVRPSDLLSVITKDDLAAIFDDYNPGLAPNLEQADFSRYGECDLSANLRFLNANGRTMTSAGLNVLQTGFSRRAWHKTKDDRYKGNGRVRHEHVNLQVGPLMNVQVHSYQAKECREREAEEWGPGGLDHFDIDVYRNVGLLGGPSHERFTVQDLYDFSQERYFVGLNELARERVILDFFHQRPNGADLGCHLTTMELFCQLCGLYADFTRLDQMTARRFKLAV